MKQCNKCGNSFPVKITIDGKSRNLQNRTLCFDCVPFGTRTNSVAFQLKKEHGVQHWRLNDVDASCCVLCGREKKRGRGNSIRLCNVCVNKARRYLSKQKAIDLLGGKCKMCGWTGNQAGFDFHHRDSSQKEFSIGNVANKSWSTIKEELQKCDLLCRNCHSIHHSTRFGDNFLQEIAIFQSRSKIYQ